METVLTRGTEPILDTPQNAPQSPDVAKESSTDEPPKEIDRPAEESVQAEETPEVPSVPTEEGQVPAESILDTDAQKQTPATNHDVNNDDSDADVDIEGLNDDVPDIVTDRDRDSNRQSRRCSNTVINRERSDGQIRIVMEEVVDYSDEETIKVCSATSSRKESLLKCIAGQHGTWADSGIDALDDALPAVAKPGRGSNTSVDMPPPDPKNCSQECSATESEEKQTERHSEEHVRSSKEKKTKKQLSGEKKKTDSAKEAKLAEKSKCKEKRTHKSSSFKLQETAVKNSKKVASKPKEVVNCGLLSSKSKPSHEQQKTVSSTKLKEHGPKTSQPLPAAARSYRSSSSSSTDSQKDSKMSHKHHKDLSNKPKQHGSLNVQHEPKPASRDQRSSSSSSTTDSRKDSKLSHEQRKTSTEPKQHGSLNVQPRPASRDHHSSLTDSHKRSKLSLKYKKTSSTESKPHGSSNVQPKPAPRDHRVSSTSSNDSRKDSKSLCEQRKTTTESKERSAPSAQPKPASRDHRSSSSSAADSQKNLKPCKTLSAESKEHRSLKVEPRPASKDHRVSSTPSTQSSKQVLPKPASRDHRATSSTDSRKQHGSLYVQPKPASRDHRASSSSSSDSLRHSKTSHEHRKCSSTESKPGTEPRAAPRDYHVSSSSSTDSSQGESQPSKKSKPSAAPPKHSLITSTESRPKKHKQSDSETRKLGTLPAYSSVSLDVKKHKKPSEIRDSRETLTKRTKPKKDRSAKLSSEDKAAPTSVKEKTGHTNRHWSDFVRDSSLSRSPSPAIEIILKTSGQSLDKGVMRSQENTTFNAGAERLPLGSKQSSTLNEALRTKDVKKKSDLQKSSKSNKSHNLAVSSKSRLSSSKVNKSTKIGDRDCNSAPGSARNLLVHPGSAKPTCASKTSASKTGSERKSFALALNNVSSGNSSGVKGHGPSTPIRTTDTSTEKRSTVLNSEKRSKDIPGGQIAKAKKRKSSEDFESSTNLSSASFDQCLEPLTKRMATESKVSKLTAKPPSMPRGTYVKKTSEQSVNNPVTKTQRKSINVESNIGSKHRLSTNQTKKTSKTDSERRHQHRTDASSSRSKKAIKRKPSEAITASEASSSPSCHGLEPIAKRMATPRTGGDALQAALGHISPQFNLPPPRYTTLDELSSDDLWHELQMRQYKVCDCGVATNNLTMYLLLHGSHSHNGRFKCRECGVECGSDLAFYTHLASAHSKI